MPKPKPDNIIRHEIVLGRADRELLDTAVTAYTANRVLTPLVALVSDVSALTAIFIVLEASGFLDIIPNELRENIELGGIKTLEEAEDAWKKLTVLAEVAAGAAPPTAKLATPLPVRIGLAILLGKKELI